MQIDALSVVHAGNLRTGPPATGVELQRDVHLRAHSGWLALLDGTELEVDEVFCVKLLDDENFEVALAVDEVFCVKLLDDEDFGVALAVDEVFCVVLEEDDEVQL